MSRRAAVPAAAKATWARRPASGCRKRTLRRRFCRPIKHEGGRQLTLWRSVGHLDSLRDQNQSCCSTSRRSRKSTTDPLNMEHMRKQAGRKLAWARCYRYTSSSDQLRVALLKLQPASRRGEHGRRHTPPCPVWRCEIVTCGESGDRDIEHRPAYFRISRSAPRGTESRYLAVSP